LAGLFQDGGNQMTLTDAEKAYQRIKEDIVTLKMRPGALIHEVDLMEELEFGRTPIREALKRLQSENLVIASPRRGMFVADIAITDLTQIYEIRVELEALCARLAAQRATSQQLHEMKALVDECQQAAQNDKEQLMALDRRFHGLLAKASQNRFLRSELDRFNNLSLRIWYLALAYAQPEDLDIPAHADILRAIETGDEEQAERRMRRHIVHFHETIKQYL